MYKELTETQIESNWNQLLKLIETSFSGERKDKLLRLYKDNADAIAMAPASGKLDYHNCYVGGYVEHVIHVLKCALKTAELWKSFDATIDWTTEELIFSALNHDLGKIGDTNGNEYYLPNDSQWHIKNRGELFKHNDKLQFMDVPDRSLWILQKYDINVSENEWLAIKLHDGMYSDANKYYFAPFSEGRKLKTNLPYVLHHADMMASRIEYEKYKREC